MKNSCASSVLQNGFLSEQFLLGKVCIQGDPISPYIFLLCAEVMAILIRNSDKVEGFKMDNKEYKISQKADDTSLILDGSPESLDSALSLLDLFARMSGLNMNILKAKVICIGNKKYSKEVFHHDKWKLKWEDSNFTMLGINYSIDLNKISQLNYD